MLLFLCFCQLKELWCTLSDKLPLRTDLCARNFQCFLVCWFILSHLKMCILCEGSLLIKIFRKPAIFRVKVLSISWLVMMRTRFCGAVQLVQDSVLSFGVSAIVDHYGYGDGIRQFLSWSSMEYFTAFIF